MIILGIDLGKARTGVAVCDRAEMLASPLCVIQEHNRERLIEKIVKLSNERRAEQIALGLPKNMDGSEGESAQNAREFGALLQEKTGHYGDCPWLSKSDRCQGEKKKGCGGQRRRGHYFTELFGL